MTTEETLTWHLKLPGISAEQTHGPIASRDRIFSYGHEGLLSGADARADGFSCPYLFIRTRLLLVSASFHGSRTMKRWTVCSAVTAEETAIFGTCAAAVAVGAQIPISCSRSCAGPRAALR